MTIVGRVRFWRGLEESCFRPACCCLSNHITPSSCCLHLTTGYYFCFFAFCLLIFQKRYRVFVNRLAKISRVFAYLFATVVMYIAMAVAARLLLPKLVRWLACETVLPAALSQMYPFVATAMCLAFTEGEGDSQPQPPPTSPPPRRRRGRGSRDGADGRRVNSSNNSNNGEQVEDGGGGGESSSEKLRYWLDYWMVYSAYQWLRAVALSFAGAQSATAAAWWKPAWLTRLCLEAELAWFVWLLVVPYLSSITAGATTDDEQDDEDEDDDNLLLLSKTPLYHIARAVGGAAQFIQNHVAAVCSEAAWQYFLNVVSPFLALATTLRMLSPAARDRIVHVLSELRTVVLPAALSLVPGIASRVAIPYARTVLPLAKSNAATETAKASRQRKRQRRANGNAGGGGGDASLLRISCQYWILQFLTTSLLKQTSLIWWLSWLPLGNLVIFAVWWQLSFPMAIELIYGLVVEELERSVVYIFYHVDQQMSSGATAADANDGEEADAVANGEKNVQTPRLVAAAGWFFSKLPSAHDLQERPAAARPSPRRPRRESSHGQRGERATRDEANADDGEEEDAVVEDQEEEVEDPAESDDESFNPGSDMEGDDDSRPRRKQHANASSSVSSSAGRGRRAAAEAPPARRATRRTTRNASPLY